MAADQGKAEAQLSLGLVYKDGLVGVYSEEPLRWFRNVAVQSTAGANEQEAPLVEGEPRRKKKQATAPPTPLTDPFLSLKTCADCGAAEAVSISVP
jgi:hypothetical protein